MRIIEVFDETKEHEIIHSCGAKIGYYQDETLLGTSYGESLITDNPIPINTYKYIICPFCAIQIRL